MLTVPGSRHEPPRVRDLQRQQEQLPLPLGLFAGRTAHRERTRQGELEVGIGCIPDSISKDLEHSGVNALQQVNIPQVPVEKKPRSNQHFSPSAVAKSLLGVFSLSF